MFIFLVSRALLACLGGRGGVVRIAVRCPIHLGARLGRFGILLNCGGWPTSTRALGLLTLVKAAQVSGGGRTERTTHDFWYFSSSVMQEVCASLGWLNCILQSKHVTGARQRP